MQEENQMHTDQLFINVRTGEVIEISGTDAELSKVATVTVTGRRVRPRTMKTSTLKTTYLSRRGTPWKSAYVAIRALPEDHPLAGEISTPSAPVQDENAALPDFSSMTDAEVSAYANEQNARVELNKFLMDKTKEELHRRHPVPRPYLNGNVAVTVSPNSRFDAPTAQKNLTAEEYKSIMLLKPDAKRAQAFLTPARYKLTLKDHGNKIEIRPASDSHRRRVADLEEKLRIQSEMKETPDGDEAPEDPFIEDPFAEDYGTDR